MNNRVISRARAHLAVVLGEKQATELLASCLARLGLSDVTTADELLRFGELLVGHGGFVEVVGRFVRVEAINASEHPPEPLRTSGATGRFPRSTSFAFA